MSQNEEPERISATREGDRALVNWSVGAWLGCVVVAVVMMLLSELEYRPAMAVGSVFWLGIAVGCFFLWKRSEEGSISRGFSSVLGILSLFGGVMSLLPWGVTEWH